MRSSAVLDTPIGGIGVRVADAKVVQVSFGASPQAVPVDGPEPFLASVLAELAAYFAGERTEFSVPSTFAYGSEFERAVWTQIATIPYGRTRSYGEIARAVGEPGAAQAVGVACGRNPVPVIVPCHRVVGADGKLVGFGGGLPRKRFLLTLETRVAIERSLLDPQP